VFNYYPSTSSGLSKEEVESIFVKFRAQGYAVGVASADDSIDVCMDPAALFGRHFAVLGQSGAGKSWTVANLLQRAVKSMPKAHIIGTGSSIPKRILYNSDLESIIDTSDEWITRRTGIKERRISS